MSRIHLADMQWTFIRPRLPPPAHIGRPRADDRRTIEGILYILVTGCRWQDLPSEYGAPTTVWRRLKRWGEEGVWERIWRAALAALDMQGQLDWRMAFLDGSFAPAKKGGEHVGLTRKGKGTKWMLVTATAMASHLATILTALPAPKSDSPSGHWIPSASLDLAVVPSDGPRNWWPTVGMLVGRSVVCCGAEASVCASLPNAALPCGELNVDGRSSHVRRTTGCATQ